MVSSRVVNVPIELGVVPTLVPAPLALKRTSRRSGSAPADRVENDRVSPLFTVRTGSSSQLLTSRLLRR